MQSGPRNLAIVSSDEDIILVHISTDYVFGGNKDVNEVYSEEDEKNPVTMYGLTKYDGEEAIKRCCFNYYIFRTAWLYGNGNNFVRTMLDLGRQKDELSVVNDQHGSPTYAVDLANIIHQAIDKHIPYGVYHATNLGYTTWYDFTKEIFEIAVIECDVKPVSSEEFVRPAKRPMNSKLSKDKLLATGIEVPEYKDALKRYLKEELK